LRLSSYNTNAHSSATIASYANFASTLGASEWDFSRNLLMGVDFKGVNNSSPDAVDLYEMSDPNTPMLIAQYNFPTNQQNNANFIGTVVMAGTTVWALDANAALMSLSLAPNLTIVSSGSTVICSWPGTAAGFTLQATPDLVSQVWTNVGAGTIVGNQYAVTNVTSAAGLFYRLKH
jgi:hypothetical protein